MYSKTIVALIIVLLLAFFLINTNKEVEKSKTFEVMGTFLTITVKSSHPDEDIQAAYKRIKDIEKVINRFDPNSEISRINSSSDKVNNFKISTDTFNCLVLAQTAADMTDGAFDITLNGDYKSIVLDPNLKTLTFLKPGIKLDLDGIAKGYAVEEAKKILSKRGIKDALIDMRSSIAVIDAPKKIGIKNPLEEDGILEVIVLTSQEALSTSGIYEQGLHIKNPKTQKKAGEILGVTIVGKDAGLLDALSTGISVMGPEKGFEFAKKNNLPIIIITKDRKILRYKL